MIKIISFLIMATSGISLHCQFFHLNGKVIEQQTGEAVPYVKLDIVDLEGRALEELETDAHGNFNLRVESRTGIQFYLSKDSFRTTSFILNSTLQERHIHENLKIEMKRALFPVKKKNLQKAAAVVHDTKVQLSGTGNTYTILFKISQENIGMEGPDVSDYPQLQLYKKDGKYFYTTGSFNSRAKADHYLKSMILDRHPTAFVVETQAFFQTDSLSKSGRQ